MCGRNTLFSATKKIIDELKIEKWSNSENYKPTFNLAPTQSSYVMIKNRKRVIRKMRWGFGFNSSRPLIFNARVETLNQKPLFKTLIKSNRCVIASDGYFEWKTDNNEKYPYFIYRENKNILPMAGLCKWDQDLFGNRKLVYTVITKEARDSLHHIHGREPVVLNEQGVEAWVNIFNKDYKDPLSILDSTLNSIVSHRVNKFVNSAKNNNHICIKKAS